MASRLTAFGRRPALVWVLFGLLVLQRAAAASEAAAPSLPSRMAVYLRCRCRTSRARRSSDYRIPGLILLLVLGILPLVVAFGVLRRHPWAWFGAFAVGCGLIIFEVVEIGVIGYNVQQPIWGTIGLLIVMVSLAPSVQRSCGLRRGRRA